MRFDVITLFPELVDAVAKSGIVKRAAEQQRIQLHCWNPRDYTQDRHRTVDDRPYGGGPGMVMKADCLLACIQAVKQHNSGKVIYLSPQGQVLRQTAVNHFAQQQSLILLCGRYEGIDERLIATQVDEEWSVGDYVLSGGELAAMIMIDTMTRLLPNVLGHHESAQQDSFSDGLLDCPHYTRPEVIANQRVPDVLLGGNHAEIAQWRRMQALGRTYQRRPDLLIEDELSEQDQHLLAEYLSTDTNKS
ncbi:MAG: tRNA (guanosine(37)-N1)-methyltransferase TrmD [bacterium]